ncbi:MAG: energy transducer TonB [Bacteroidota bacterium]
MKKSTTFFALTLLLSAQLHAQVVSPPVDDKFDSTKAYVKVEQEASFPGGLEAWTEFLQKTMKTNVPRKNKAPIGRYQVIARFIVDTEGKLSDIECETNHGYGLEAEVIRVLKKSPDWNPAKLNGKPVKAYRRQPVTFLVEAE